MLGIVCLCVLALALPCWAFPSGNTITTCDKFNGTSFDPSNAVGEWFSVASSNMNNNVDTLSDDSGSVLETTTIRELTSSQLELYDELVRSYSKDILKLEFKMRLIQHSVDVEMHIVMVPQDKAGLVDVWLTYFRVGTTIDTQISSQRTMKWKIVDGFLALVMCVDGISDKNLSLVLSKTASPDKDKLQQAIDKLDIKDMIWQN